MQWNTAISCVGSIYSDLTISSRLITMVFLERFTADCSSFSSMKDLRWVLLKVFWLSWVYCRSETNTAHYSDKTFQRSDNRPGMESVFPVVCSQYVFTKASLVFHDKRRENSYSHVCKCYFVLPVHLHSNTGRTPPHLQEKLCYGNLIFMLAWCTCQINLNVLIFLTGFLSSTLFLSSLSFCLHRLLLIYKMLLHSSLMLKPPNLAGLGF